MGWVKCIKGVGKNGMKKGVGKQKLSKVGGMLGKRVDALKSVFVCVCVCVCVCVWVGGCDSLQTIRI